MILNSPEQRRDAVAVSFYRTLLRRTASPARNKRIQRARWRNISTRNARRAFESTRKTECGANGSRPVLWCAPHPLRSSVAHRPPSAAPNQRGTSRLAALEASPLCASSSEDIAHNAAGRDCFLQQASTSRAVRFLSKSPTTKARANSFSTSRCARALWAS